MAETLIRREGKDLQIFGEGGVNVSRILGLSLEDVKLTEEAGVVYAVLRFPVTVLGGLRVTKGETLKADLDKAAELLGMKVTWTSLADKPDKPEKPGKPEKEKEEKKEPGAGTGQPAT